MDLNRKPYNEYQPDLYDTFSKIMGLARELNTSLDPPEFVFIGQNNHGKTALLEGFLGHSFTKGKPTKRPVQINLINNPKCENPKVTIKRDDFLWSKAPEYCRDIEACNLPCSFLSLSSQVPVDEVGKELQKRNVYSTVPIYVNYEWRQVWNMCLIDTPPLTPFSKYFLGPEEDDTDTDRDDDHATKAHSSSTASHGPAGDEGGPSGAASVAAATPGTTIHGGPKAEPPSPVKAPASIDGASAAVGGGGGGGDDKGGANAGTDGDGGDSGTESLKGGRLLKGKKVEDKKTARMQQAILELIAPAERFIVAVEEAAGTNYALPRVVQAVDPKYHRTIFVYTKFQDHLKTLVTTKAVNLYLNSFQPNCRTFVTSIPQSSSSVYSKGQGLKDKISDAIKDDMRMLESLQFDKRHTSAIGAHSFRRHVLELAWRHYLEVVPEILKNLSTKKNTTMNKLYEVSEQLSNMEAGRLRTLATAYAMSFLTNLERLVKGTLDGIPTQNGQTLEEEMDTPGTVQPEVGDWLDLSFRPIMLFPEEWNIPYTQNKLYGKQQFERLLSQFRAITEHTEMGVVTMDDVACSAGPTKISTISNYAWVASDLAKRKVEKTLKPLIEQLKQRAVYVLKRLVDIVDKMVAVQKMKKSAQGPSSKLVASTCASSTMRNMSNRHSTGLSDKGLTDASGDFPYFIHSVKVLFSNFVDEVAQDCFDKCQDEFFCTQIIYWDMIHFSEHKFPERSNSLDLYEQKEEVTALARILYKEIRERVATNVLLKFHNFFFVPMQSDLWGAVQGKVTSLSDAQLAELFQVEPNKVALKEQEAKLQAQMKSLAGLEVAFMECSSSYSRPK